MASDAVQQVKDRISIIDVVTPYVELHNAGKNLKGKSPFTNEKTPSFFVSPDRGMYYCFSTSKGGDIFTFIQEIEGVDFKGALKILAEKAGVELVPEDPKKRSEREDQYAVLDAVTTFWQRLLLENKSASAYLKDRGVSGQTIAKWRIGYAPGPPHFGWRDSRAELLEQKYTDEQLKKAGLVKDAGAGKEPYDVFRDRVMFPICDASGRVVAFSGRLLSKETEAPKYVNSPETELFNKSEILFGYDKAKEGIRRFDFSLLVEGQFDVVLAHQAGYTNAVAVSGTAFTPEHAALLGRLSQKIVLALDADRAGIAAVKRAADVLLGRGMDVKVARLPDGEDPADIIGADPKQFKTIIGQATHVIEFLLSVIKTEAKDDRTYKLRAREEIIPYIVRIDNHIDREHFEGIVAEALGTTKDAVHLEVLRHEEKQTTTPTPVNTTDSEVVVSEPSVRGVIDRQQELGEYLVMASELIEPAERTVLRKEYKVITGKELTADSFVISPNEKGKLLFTLEAQLADLSDQLRRDELAFRLQEFRKLTIKLQLQEAREALQAAESAGEESTQASVMSTITNLHQQLAAEPYTAEIFQPEPA